MIGGAHHASLSPIKNKGGEFCTTDNAVSRPRATNKQNDVASRYLRASTGSCHDACKYGKPHEFIDKPWKPQRRTLALPPDRERTFDLQIFVDRRVKDAGYNDKLEPTPAKVYNPNEKVDVGFPSSKKCHSSKPIRQEVNVSKVSRSSEVPKTTKKVVRSADALRSTRQEVASSVKKTASTNRALSNAKERNVSIDPLKPNGKTVKPSSSSKATKFEPKRMNEPKNSDKARTSRVAPKSVPIPSTVTSSLKSNSRVEMRQSSDVGIAGSNLRKIRSPKNETKISQASTENQILINSLELKKPITTRQDSLSAVQHGTELIQSPSPLTPESLNLSSPTNSNSFTSHETDSEANDLSTSNGSGTISSLNVENKVTHCGKARAFKNDKNPKSMKLTFRREKVVELQSESNTPAKRRYRRRATETDKKESETVPVKVVLKHQDVETKKEAQVLLNNVIEQTANKLVETRKSKVKALVGAFETVISLQEGKSATADR